MKTVFTLEDYQLAARTYAKELALMPYFKCADALQYMRGLPGIRFQHAVGTAESNAQFAPYKKNRKSDNTLRIAHRILETFFGNVVEDFEPNEVITTLLGKNAPFLGDGQKNAPSAKLVLATVMASLGEHLHDELFTAVRNAEGDTTHDLFNGWGTIIRGEMAEGTISEQKDNLLRLDEDVTNVNAVDLAKEILFSLNPKLRRQDLFLYCDQHFADMYNEAYLTSHTGLVYNKQYNQVSVEGSSNRLTIIPLACMPDDLMIVTNKNNMLYGYDDMGDITRIQVDRFAPFELTLSAAMFFGTQIESIDPRRFKAITINDGAPKAPKITQTQNSIAIAAGAGETVKYSIDGASWDTYSSPITATSANNGKEIRAKAIKDGNESDVATHTIVYNS